MTGEKGEAERVRRRGGEGKRGKDERRDKAGAGERRGAGQESENRKTHEKFTSQSNTIHLTN